MKLVGKLSRNEQKVRKENVQEKEQQKEREE